MYSQRPYWRRCYYCKKLVRGGIRGIGGHLRGCPYIRTTRTYTFKDVSYLVDAGPSTLEFIDMIFQLCTLEDGAVFLKILQQFDKKKHGGLRYSYQVIETGKS